MAILSYRLLITDDRYSNTVVILWSKHLISKTWCTRTAVMTSCIVFYVTSWSQFFLALSYSVLYPVPETIRPLPCSSKRREEMVVALRLLYSFAPNEPKLTDPHTHWGRCSKSKEKGKSCAEERRKGCAISLHPWGLQPQRLCLNSH